MYIAGSYDDMQGGICYGGIAHAGPPRPLPAAWFDGIDDYLTLASPTSGVLQSSYFLFIVHASFGAWPGYVGMLISNKRSVTTGWDVYRRETTIEFRRHNAALVLSCTPPASLTQIAYYQSPTTANIVVGESSAITTPIAITPGTKAVYVGRGATDSLKYIGVIRDIKLYDTMGMSDAQIEAIIADPSSAMPALWLKGDGNTDVDWIDRGSEGVHHGTVYGSPDPTYIRGDDKIIVNGEVKNPD